MLSVLRHELGVPLRRRGWTSGVTRCLASPSSPSPSSTSSSYITRPAITDESRDPLDVGVFRPPTDPLALADAARKHRELAIPLRVPRLPVVLCHGMGGDKPFLPYFHGIAADLAAGGVTVYQTRVYKYGDVYQRAAKLKIQLDNILQHSGARKVNLITHSMGGLDARQYITHLGGHEHISSMTSIGTPHRGSCFADFCVSHLLDGLALGRFLDLLPMETGAPRNLIRSFLLDVFNPETPDHPSVHYLSYPSAARITNPLHPLFLPWQYIRRVEGDNDGLVSVESARWGTVIRTLDLCHASQINWTPYDARALYRELMGVLYDEGH